jgi:hypothetical protein
MIRPTGWQLHKLALLWRCVPVRRTMEPPVIERHVRERVCRFNLIRIVVPAKHCLVPQCDVCASREWQRKDEKGREGGFENYHEWYVGWEVSWSTRTVLINKNLRGERGEESKSCWTEVVVPR